MPTDVIVGPERGGKTTLLTLLHLRAVKAHQQVYTNVPGMRLPHTLIRDVPAFVESMDTYRDCLVIFDEAHNYFHARRSASDVNLHFTDLQVQSTKLNRHIVLSTHNFRRIDVLIRQNCRYLISVHYDKTLGRIKCTYANLQRPDGVAEIVATKSFDPRPLWNLFDTTARVARVNETPQ